LRSQGVLTSPTTAAAPWIRNFDEITQTPWLYNPTNKVYVSYDDPISLGVKTKHALSKDLAGLFVWSVEQDNGELLSAINPMIAGNGPRHPVTSGTVAPTASATGSQSASSSATPTSSPGGCGSVAAWSASVAYTGGAEVSYEGNVYKAQWWTQGETPSTSTSWGAWKLSRAC
jgi:chitinase